ncbi:DUF6415 family natural product biosynthesis protein [Streptomyces sp. WAC00263]|uniref:DUF6415 family natural product biosynthesis protein n=1 Tax=Streptomyces sp. WAC00263 TaxID=1917422 RepID=UPI0015EF3724|nr:DUF6415 family natural product biosynthesis protein [Streptomyces sp. WAC00263]KAF5990242.1 restriction endonuclease [Streptomyces sp. WAC00263]KAF5990627.1 restriction endonuclease [Streptomyces sp. WAC00263]
MSDTPVQTSGTVLCAPDCLLAADLPLDREPILLLATAVLALPKSGDAPPPQDCEQIGRLLAGHARLVADGVQGLCDRLPRGSSLRPLTETVLGEARGRLSVGPRPTVASAQNRARLVRILYERLDRLTSADSSA